jgi:thiol-disulfide isomerase/thioredoxin
MGVSTTEIKSAGQYDRELKEHSSVSSAGLFSVVGLHALIRNNNNVIQQGIVLLQVAVFFWASWSQPCKQLQLVFEQLAKDTSSAQFLTVRDSRRVLCDPYALDWSSGNTKV